MSNTHSYLRDHDYESMRRAEHRHARRIKDKAKMRELMRQLLAQRALDRFDEDDDDE